MVDIFNRMLSPSPPRDATTFDFGRDRVLHAKEFGGIHFEFLQIWPDSAGRAWMGRDLAAVPQRTPVIVFVHDQPDAEAKHFINPNPLHDINAIDQFENLLADTLQDGRTSKVESRAEQAELETFLRAHRNVTAYFHGNSN